ncbi:heparinase II/III family protein [Alkaliphilus hydrothermalis]|uniref:Heparin-sulfate lyase N-terminal domain-containing protein n=1 Tax=Alkaliphilus hydrothermalis TaxID=1482730 RepID=A0ABS2NR87_9FIRM|nr:alginate lyase family protein [Alkaliphilus hydrothermalis]MBM7615470.1 hypothetical protein [Alkaliphilus hydrothermalis]
MEIDKVRLIEKEAISGGLSKADIDYLLAKENRRMFKRTNLTGDEAVNIGTLIMDNHIYLMEIWKEYPYKGKLDWKIDPYKDKSWTLYYHSLRMVSYLCNAYETTGELQYLDKSKEIISDWIENNHIEKLTVKIAWNEHSASNRVLNMIYYLEMIKQTPNIDYEFMNSLLLALYVHGEFLADTKNYVANNHGIMQDKALMELSLFYNEFEDANRWLDNCLKRLLLRFHKDITHEGVHLEHSPYYHIFVLQLFTDIEEMLNFYGKSLGEASRKTFALMKEYLAYAIKPDGKLPTIGDTNDALMEERKIFDHPFLDYVLSQGKEGVRPTATSKVYPVAGIGIFRDKWKTHPNFHLSTYLFFHAGFHSTTHKHGDDLSFILSALGKDIFIDPGKYNYDKYNKYRQYFRSTCSHNTITVDGKEYRLKEENIGKSKLLGWNLTEEYDWIKGEHTLYEGVRIIREILFIKPNAIVILDSIESGKFHSYQQIFNLAPGITVRKKDYGGFEAVFENKELKILLTQVNPVDKVKSYSASEKPLKGYASPRTNQLVKIQQVVFEKKGKDIEFITAINIKSKQYENKIRGIQIKNYQSTRQIKYYCDGVLKTIHLKR